MELLIEFKRSIFFYIKACYEYQKFNTSNCSIKFIEKIAKDISSILQKIRIYYMRCMCEIYWSEITAHFAIKAMYSNLNDYFTCTKSFALYISLEFYVKNLALTRIWFAFFYTLHRNFHYIKINQSNTEAT